MESCICLAVEFNYGESSLILKTPPLMFQPVGIYVRLMHYYIMDSNLYYSILLSTD